MGRRFRFSRKQWHNMLLLTLVQNPVVILCTHKPLRTKYSSNQYLPYDKWDECLALYRRFLITHHIPYVEYDYSHPTRPQLYAFHEGKNRGKMLWWKPMWEAGYGAVGSPCPKVLLVAERIGPNNMNSIPFETGPTGYMLSDMLASTSTPLGKIAVTNLVKSFRRDTRSPNKADLDLLYVELKHMAPELVVFMGTPAKEGIRVAKELGIQHAEIQHLGYYHRRGVTDMSAYYAQWRQLLGMTPTLSLKSKEV